MDYDITVKKICTHCKEEKLRFVDFSTIIRKNRKNPQIQSQCKQCHSKTTTESRNKDREKYLARQAQWREKNKEKIKAYHEDEREANLIRFKEYRRINKEAIKLAKHKHSQNPENKAKRNEKARLRKRLDSAFRIMANVRTRIHNILKQNKVEKTDKLLGCNKTQLKIWLNFQLYDNLTWDNYGYTWHIDHIIPLAFFDLSDVNEQLLACNWSNLRPLYVEENLSKNDKILENEIRNHIKIVDSFLELNSGYQANNDTCWCRRLKVSVGENSQDTRSFEDFLKWTISSENTFSMTFND
jgi:hypothetical protein